MEPLRDKIKGYIRRHQSVYGIVALNPPAHILSRKRPQRNALSCLYYLQQAYRINTSHLRGLPDFVIIGAQKSGTSSLYHFLTKHTAIAPGVRKEIHYFSVRYDLGKMWYCSHFPTNLSRRRFYKKTGQKLLSGEASPSYLLFPTVPSRMKDVLPNVKLIVVLRNPVDRTYSNYHHMLKKKWETLSFEKAIKLEEERCAGEREKMISDPHFVPKHLRSHAYLAGGIYADQLENWFKHYSREQFLILDTEDLRNNPQRVLDQIFDFLGVPPFHVENLKNRNIGNYKEMNKDTRKFLVEYFRPHNKRLYKLLQRDFDWDK